jgi:hypothetical protein
MHNHHFASAFRDAPVTKNGFLYRGTKSGHTYHSCNESPPAAGKRKSRALSQKHFAVQINDFVVRPQTTKESAQLRIGGIGQLVQQNRIAPP